MRGARQASRHELRQQLCGLLQDWRSGEISPGAARVRWNRIADVLTNFSLGPSSPKLAYLAGECTALDPIQFHAASLSNINWNSLRDCKISYHLAMIGHTLFPLDEAFLPKVSLMIAGPSSRAGTAESASCCLRQSHEKLEVIVENSMMGIEDPRVRVLPENGTVEASRSTRCLAAASGEFVEFVEPGDCLDADAVAAKVRAFVDVCDAKACYSTVNSIPGHPPAEFQQDELSVIGDALLAAVSNPGTLSQGSVMMPRWFAEQVDPSEWDREHSHKERYWFLLARAGVKAVALRHPVARRAAGTNSTSTQERLRRSFDACIQNAQDLAEEPAQYRYLAAALSRATLLLDQLMTQDEEWPVVHAVHRRLLDFERTMGQWHSHPGQTALLLDQVAIMLYRLRQSTPNRTARQLELWDERLAQLDARLDDAPAVSWADVRRWLPPLVRQPYVELSFRERSMLKGALTQLQWASVFGSLQLRFQTLDLIAKDFPGHPYARFWRTASRMSTVIGQENARQVIRRRFFRQGWHLLGRARRVMTGGT